VATKNEIARKYAALIQEGADADAAKGRTAGRLMESFEGAQRSPIVASVLKVSGKLDRLTSYDEPISDELRQEIVELIAEVLRYPKPNKLGTMLREGSVTALMTMSQSMEDLFAAIRK
jgi:hypothetical protein